MGIPFKIHYKSMNKKAPTFMEEMNYELYNLYIINENNRIACDVQIQCALLLERKPKLN
jgi:hypothetical protein